MRRGNPERALKSIDKAWKIAVDNDEWLFQKLYLNARGLSYLALKEMEQARKTADELNARLENGANQNRMWMFFLLEGRIELEKKHYSLAIDNFEKGLSLLSVVDDVRVPFIDSLGMTSFRAGDLDRAQNEYTRLTELNFGKLDAGDTFATAYYMLGKIYEAQENTAQAIENYERFLTLWKDADPGIKEVEDARVRLAELRDQTL